MADPAAYELARAYMQAYTTGVFEPLFGLFTDDYEHISFWVLEVIRGKERAMEYYTGKGAAMRREGSAPKGILVEITDAPDVVRPAGLFRGGYRQYEDPAFLNRHDAGRIAVLLEQQIDGETIRTLAIPTPAPEGRCRQLLIANPGFYKWKDVEA